jgi:hypothetical protein
MSGMVSSKLCGGLTGIIVLLAWPVTVSGKVIYVNAHTHGSNNGTSWENAYDFLQDALADAKSSPKPVEIRVAQGIHTPDRSSAAPLGTGNVQTVFGLINGVHLMGGYAGYGKLDPNEQDVEAYETVLSADLGGNDGLGWDWTHWSDNSNKIVDGSGTDASAVLDGFTITRVIGGDAGLYNSNGSPTVVNCTFSWNWAGGDGGGISNWNSSAPRVTNCTFIQNVGEDHGGGVLNNPSCNPIITNCSFTGNSVGIWNGQEGSYSGNPIATNCTFTGNSWAGIINYASSFVVTNCILWDDKPVSGTAGFPYVRPTVTYSDVKGGWIGTGNINADPCFVDAVSGDLRLKLRSACIDVGNNNVAGLPTTDLAGNPRVFDGNGNGTAIVDMGAFEYQPYCGDSEHPYPPMDFNHDCTVDFMDFGLFCVHWLECTKPECD